MFDRFKKDWEALKASDIGHRFQDRYHRRRAKSLGKSKIWRFVIVLLGFFIIGVGIIFLFIPGSGWVIIIIGTGVIAGEFLTMAKLLDIGELYIRKLIGKRN